MRSDARRFALLCKESCGADTGTARFDAAFFCIVARCCGAVASACAPVLVARPRAWPSGADGWSACHLVVPGGHAGVSLGRRAARCRRTTALRIFPAARPAGVVGEIASPGLVRGRITYGNDGPRGLPAQRLADRPGVASTSSSRHALPALANADRVSFDRTDILGGQRLQLGAIRTWRESIGLYSSRYVATTG
jgi:hypothetical protein